MTPGARVEIFRGSALAYTATVERIAPICGDAILINVRRIGDGREVRPTGTMAGALRLRAKTSTGLIIGSGGFGGELVARVVGA